MSGLPNGWACPRAAWRAPLKASTRAMLYVPLPASSGTLSRVGYWATAGEKRQGVEGTIGDSVPVLPLPVPADPDRHESPARVRFHRDRVDLHDIGLGVPQLSDDSVPIKISQSIKSSS